MILYGLMAWPAEFRGRRGVWFVDNTCGVDRHLRICRGSQIIHLCLFALNCTLYWE